MADDKVVTLNTKPSFKEVQAAAEAEVRDENLKEYKEKYKELLLQKEAALLVVRNVEREMELLAEKFGE